MLRTRNIPAVVIAAIGLLQLSLNARAAESDGAPRLTIVPAYEGDAAYATAARSDPNADRPTLYRHHVVGPYLNRCAGGGEFVESARMALSTPPTNVDGVAEAAQTLAKADLQSLILAAFDKISTSLPGPATTVCIFVADPDDPRIRDLHGIGGFTAGAGKIWLLIQPEGDWKEWVPYALAHEHHHSVWIHRHFDASKPLTLGWHLVSEGRADSFAHVVYPDRRPPWLQALTPAQEAEQWKAMQAHLDDASAGLRMSFMYGDGAVPRWTGYTVGFRIVQSFLSGHAAMSIDQWTALDARQLLKDSSYAPGSQKSGERD